MENVETQQSRAINKRKRLKIAVIAFELITPTQRTGGVSHFNHRLCSKLVDMGHDVTAITMSSSLEDANYRIHSLSASGNSKNRFHRYYASPLKGIKLNFDNYDLVISNGDDWAMRRQNTPWVRIMHGSSMRERSHNQRWIRKVNLSLLYKLEKYSAKQSTVTLYNSMDTQTCYQNRKQDKVVPLPVDSSLFYPGEKEDEPTILFVGALDSRKRGRLVLDLYISEIKEKIPNCKLWMVCNEGNPYEGVTYFNHLSIEELAELYRRAHVFCMPSTYEGFGLPYIEALASGTLVVTTPNPGANEVLDNGRRGIIVHDHELSTALVHALNRINEYSFFVHEGLKYADTQSWESIISKYLSYSK